MAEPRKAIEDAAIAALADLLLQDLGGAATGYLKKVAPYAGELRSPDPEDVELKQLIENGTPCIGVSTGSGSYDRFTASDRPWADHSLTLELLIVSGNFRGAEERNRGDGGLGADPGIYQVMKDVRDLLWSSDLGADGAGGARPVSEDPVVRTSSITAWHVIYAITADAQAADPEATDTEIATIHTEVNNADDDTADPIVEADIDLETS